MDNSLIDIDEFYQEFISICEYDSDLSHLIRFCRFLRRVALRDSNFILSSFGDDGISDCDYSIVIAISSVDFEYNKPIYSKACLHGYFIYVTKEIDPMDVELFMETLRIYEDAFDCIPFARIVQLS